jgi:cytochrome P450
MKSLTPIIGPTSIIMADGEDWRPIRKRFNPGFAPTHLVTLLPAILSKTERFTKRLDILAKTGDEFELGELCTSLTFDIIGAVVLNEDFRAQCPDQSPVVKDYRALTDAFNGAPPFSTPFSSKKRRRNKLGITVDTSIKAVVTQKFEEIQQARKDGKTSDIGRSVVELSLQDTEVLTPEILQETADQVKSFLFAGKNFPYTLFIPGDHDTGP